jgi:CRISPR/Cas system-associated endoribonuclease Cas2
MFLVIGIERISHAPLICSKTLARLQYSVYFFVASILSRSEANVKPISADPREKKRKRH